jgi:hypothetical protein
MNECSCETPRPRHAGVHPTVCQYCNLIIEAESFDDDYDDENMVGECGYCASMQGYTPENMLLIADYPSLRWDFCKLCKTNHTKPTTNCPDWSPRNPDVYEGQTWFCQGCGSGTKYLIDANKWVADAESFEADSNNPSAESYEIVISDGDKVGYNIIKALDKDMIYWEHIEGRFRIPKGEEVGYHIIDKLNRDGVGYMVVQRAEGFEAEDDYVYVGDDELAKAKGYKWCLENDRDIQNWIIPEQEQTYFFNQFGQKVSDAETFESEGMTISQFCDCNSKLAVINKKNKVILKCWDCSEYVILPKSHLSDSNKRELILIEEGFQENEDNSKFDEKYPAGITSESIQKFETFKDKSPMMQNLTIAAIGALALIIGRKVTR